MDVKNGIFSGEITRIRNIWKKVLRKIFRSKKHEVDIRWEIFELT